MSDGGSYQVASKIAREIFGIEPPVSTEYGFIGLKGGLVKISSSKGGAPTPSKILNIYEPQIIRWLFEKYQPRDFFEFGFDDTIIRHYSEYDQQAAPVNQISFGTLATVAPIANFNETLVRKMLKLDAKVDLSRLQKVKYWLENYAPDKIYKIRDGFNADFYATLNAQEKAAIEKLHEYLGAERTESEIQQFLYSLINNPKLEKKDNVELQKRYFKTFYNMLFGRDDGPRLYFFLAVARKDCLKLLRN